MKNFQKLLKIFKRRIGMSRTRKAITPEAPSLNATHTPHEDLIIKDAILYRKQRYGITSSKEKKDQMGRLSEENSSQMSPTLAASRHLYRESEESDSKVVGQNREAQILELEKALKEALASLEEDPLQFTFSSDFCIRNRCKESEESDSKVIEKVGQNSEYQQAQIFSIQIQGVGGHNVPLASGVHIVQSDMGMPARALLGPDKITPEEQTHRGAWIQGADYYYNTNTKETSRLPAVPIGGGGCNGIIRNPQFERRIRFVSPGMHCFGNHKVAQSVH